ncbi:MAG: TetR/AcrR family transcriptional regulator [Terracidiphilus sp.]|nr:TetR/AcrR family transcriptional regulator [Terracidiphilus sp.]
MKPHTSTRTQHERSEQSRERILDTAIGIFGERGLAGARTEEIATQAGVNKALLYYYFRSKEEIYRAAIELVIERMLSRVLATLETGETAGEKLARFVLNHFDNLHARQSSHKLLHQEMMHLKQDGESKQSALALKFFGPVVKRLSALVKEGQRKGELIDSDPWQMINSALGANAFYFFSAPISGLLAPRDPLSRAELKRRRTIAIEHLGRTLFCDRLQGEQVAQRVLASTPMPASTALEQWRSHHHHHEIEGKHK